MVFSPRFDVHDHDLLEPESKLNEIVPLREPRHFSGWPVVPKRPEVKPVVGVVHNVHARRPESGIVYQYPSLFRESYSRLFLINSSPRGQDRKSTRLNSSHPSISYAVF